MLRSYLESDAPRVTRSAFYRWYDEPMEALMASLAERAMAYARSQKVDLPGPLAGVKDWRIVNSTTIKVMDWHRRLLEIGLAGGLALSWVACVQRPCVNCEQI